MERMLRWEILLDCVCPIFATQKMNSLIVTILFAAVIAVNGGWVSKPASFAAIPNTMIYKGHNWNDLLQFEWNYTSSTGDVTSLSYKFQQSTPVLTLDIDDNILELNCDDNSWDGNYYVVVFWSFFDLILGSKRC